MTHRVLLERLYHAAVRGADPRAATREAVTALRLRSAPAIIAVGKAARAMVEGALEGLGTGGLATTVGLVISETGAPPVVGALPHLRGAHPVPDEHSRAAATALGDVVLRARAMHEVLVLVSGGTTSLMADAVADISAIDLGRVFEALLGSGAPITAVNTVRRRLLRWGAGRLATALAPAQVHCLLVSDVMGGDVAAIGSGPCVGDPSTAFDVRAVLRQWEVPIPLSVDDYLRRVERGLEPETPKPGDPRLRQVQARIVLDNASAVTAVRRAGDGLGLGRVDVWSEVVGEASGLGRALAAQLARAATTLGAPRLLVAGGEATVTMVGGGGSGGRCQELALAAAQELDRAGTGDDIALLAAGTDGRDGPTDAAGAVVDGYTWARIRANGRDPARDLDAHNAYAALDAAGALLRPGPTGTNVNDVIIAVVGTTDARRSSERAGSRETGTSE